jgi:hypothetical protein
MRTRLSSSGSSWRRRVYRWLTTSERNKRNWVDDVGGHLQAARRERDRVQRINDVFHRVGKGTCSGDTLEGITLQGRGEGVAWSFLLIPAFFIAGPLALISQYRRSERHDQQLVAEREWLRRLQEAADKKALADTALHTAQMQSHEMKMAVQAFAEEDALTAKLESNLEFIKDHLQSHLPPPPFPPPRSA